MQSQEVPLFVGPEIGPPHVGPVKVVFHPDMIWLARYIPTDPDVEAILRRDGARVKQLLNCEGMGC